MSIHYDNAPGLCEQQDPETQQYTFGHTMMRIKDPARSLDFYTRVLGMRLIRRFDFPEMKFTLYFLGMVSEQEAKGIPGDRNKRATWVFNQKAMLELTHNWGTENEEQFKYHSGNEEPKGFGHLGFTVPDVYNACARLEKLGITFVKKVDAGKMQGIAFVKDPDGYWIEILQSDMVETRGKDWGLAQ
jgi:lactoylglutathione lyase